MANKNTVEARVQKYCQICNEFIFMTIIIFLMFFPAKAILSTLPGCHATDWQQC